MSHNTSVRCGYYCLTLQMRKLRLRIFNLSKITQLDNEGTKGQTPILVSEHRILDSV